MNHKEAIRYRRHLENDNHAAARALIQPHALPLYYVAKYADRKATFRADPAATPAALVALALAALKIPRPSLAPPTQGPRDVTARGPHGASLTITPHPCTRPDLKHVKPDHPLTPYHAAARYRIAHQADKEARHTDPTKAAKLATTRAALCTGVLTYRATLRPGTAAASITAPATATRRQLVQMAKAALRCTRHPFRPLEYINPPRITATAAGITLEIRPVPVDISTISDDEV